MLEQNWQETLKKQITLETLPEPLDKIFLNYLESAVLPLGLTANYLIDLALYAVKYQLENLFIDCLNELRIHCPQIEWKAKSDLKLALHLKVPLEESLEMKQKFLPFLKFFKVLEKVNGLDKIIIYTPVLEMISEETFRFIRQLPNPPIHLHIHQALLFCSQQLSRWPSDLLTRITSLQLVTKVNFSGYKDSLLNQGEGSLLNIAAKLPALTSFKLNAPHFNIEDILDSFIRHCPLKQIAIKGYTKTNAIWNLLIARLKLVPLSHFTIDLIDVKEWPILESTTLISLHIVNSIKPENLKPTLPNLQILNLNCQAFEKVTDFSKLQFYPLLTHLSLYRAEFFKDEDLFNLKKLKYLRSLTLEGSKFLTSEGLLSLLEKQSLTSLHLTNCPRLDRSFLQSLPECANLRSLTLKYLPGLTDLSLLASNFIEHLTLEGLGPFTLDPLKKEGFDFFKNLPALRSLKIKNLHGFNQECLLFLRKNLLVEELDIETPELSKEALESFKSLYLS